MENIVNQIVQNNKKKVFLCGSNYNVMLAVYLLSFVDDVEKCYIVMFSNDKKLLVEFYKISKILQKKGIKNVVINKHKKPYRIIGLSHIENIAVFRKVMRELGVNNNDFMLVNFAWTQQKPIYPANIYLKYCKEAIFIEEGTAQYVKTKRSKLFLLIEQFYGTMPNFWEIDKIKAIYVQNPEKFCTYLKPSLSRFTLNSCFRTMAADTKNMLLDIFTDAQSKKEIAMLEQQHFDGIIFTQPLSEDRYTTEKEKVRIYTDILKFYSRYGTVCLKVHPRDSTKYNMDGVDILNGSYPSELLAILGIRFKFAVGLCTSAVETVDADVRLNLNENFLKELTYELAEL